MVLGVEPGSANPSRRDTMGCSALLWMGAAVLWSSESVKYPGRWEVLKLEALRSPDLQKSNCHDC